MIYLTAAAVAWVVAQGLKHLARLAGRNRRVFGGNPRSKLLLSGGMPSAHSATVMALAVVVGLVDGVDSGLFAVALLLALIVMYDAVMIRYSSGRQGDLLNRLIIERKSKLETIPVAHGHTVAEMVAGAMIGAAIGIVVFSTMK